MRALALVPPCLWEPRGTCLAGATVPAKLCAAVALCHAFSCASACHCTPLGTIPASAIVRAKVAPDVRAGRSPLRATAAPHALALPDEEKSALTRTATRWDHFFLIVRSVPRLIAWLTTLFNPARLIRSLENFCLLYFLLFMFISHFFSPLGRS